MINVSRLMTSSNFATTYKVHRSSGKWVKGRFVIDEENTLDYYGPVQPADNNDLDQFPEGDKQRGLMKFFCAPPNEIYTTMDSAETESEEAIISDVIEYDGSLFKIIRIAPWAHNGFIRAFGYKVGVVSKNG